MVDPTFPLPELDVFATGERATLVGFLDYYRAVLARKAAGISEEQARAATCPPSDLTILGLIRHMADVERGWAQNSFAGQVEPPIHYGVAHPDGDPDGDFHPPPDATLGDALIAYWTEIERADDIYASKELGDIEEGPRRRHSLRWIYVHLIEEYARHCGHADLIRQAIDGATGD